MCHTYFFFVVWTFTIYSPINFQVYNIVLLIVITILGVGFPEFIHLLPAATAKSLQSCPILCDPIDGSPPGSAAPGILQARKLDWVAISFSNAWKWKVKGKLLSRVRLCDPMDCSLAGSSVHGIFQARVLEWGCHCLLPPSAWKFVTFDQHLPSLP